MLKIRFWSRTNHKMLQIYIHTLHIPHVSLLPPPWLSLQPSNMLYGTPFSDFLASRRDPKTNGRLAQGSWHSKHSQPTHPPTSDSEWENDSPPRLTNRWCGMRMTPPYIQTAEGEKIKFFEEVLKGVHFCCPPAAAMTCHWNALLAIHFSCWMLRWLGCCTLR